MKLLRVGQKGKEKPAILDTEGKIRDISSHVGDLNPDHINFDTISTSSLGPTIQLVAFINIIGSDGTSAPVSAAWSE